MKGPFTSRWGLPAISLGILFALGAGQASASDEHAVDFRLASWKTAHFDSAENAEVFAKTLTQLGCEAVQQAHGGHIDVSYRCPAWRRMTADDHAAAHRWEAWLKSKGFETKHQH